MKKLMLFVVVTLFMVPAAFAQMGRSGEKEAGMAGCEMMMKRHADMEKQMTAMNEKLQSLVDDMNRAEGAAKVDKMAAVINELVAQRATMQKQMAMQPQMMQHMMGHMKNEKGSMSSCPMMKQGDQQH